MNLRLATGLLSALFPLVAFADLPLVVEDLLTDRGKVRLDFSVAYANSERSALSADGFITVQTGPTSFLAIPTRVGEKVSNTDSFVGTLGLRYGLPGGAELYGRISAFASAIRSSGVSGNERSGESGLTDARIGINRQFKDDGATPALLGFVEVGAYEKHRESSAQMKSFMMGLTSYSALDPIVLSLTAAYRFHLQRKDGSRSFKPADLFLLNPNVAFAVNDRVTLTTGFQWTGRSSSRYDGLAVTQAHTSTDMIFGVAGAIKTGTTLHLTFKTSASGRAGSEVRVNLLRTF